MRITTGLALDAALICLFAAIGRRNHGETSALLEVAVTAFPFLTGMATAWLVFLLASRRAPLSVREGIPVWLATVSIGILLRSLTDAGTAFSFVVVATLFLGGGLLGWRGVVARATGPRS